MGRKVAPVDTDIPFLSLLDASMSSTPAFGNYLDNHFVEDYRAVSPTITPRAASPARPSPHHRTVRPSSIMPVYSFSTTDASDEIAAMSAFKLKLDKLVDSNRNRVGLRTGLVQARRLNHALLLIKPHASTVAAQYLITSTLEARKMRVLSRGKFSGKELESQGIFDRHYATVRKFATIADVGSIQLSSLELKNFSSRFRADWKEEVCVGHVLSASDAMSYFGIDAAALFSLWMHGEPRIKLRKGLHVSQFHSSSLPKDSPHRSKLAENEPIYILNGFFPSMRADCLSPEAVVHYMVVEWEGSQLSWRQVLSDVVGTSEPGNADVESIRGHMFRDWQRLGLERPPDRRDNGVHFSASAFEGLAERLIWVPGTMLFTDPFGSRLLSCNIPSLTVENWLHNPPVQQRAIFDHMNQLDGQECLSKAKELLG